MRTVSEPLLPVKPVIKFCAALARADRPLCNRVKLILSAKEIVILLLWEAVIIFIEIMNVLITKMYVIHEHR